MSNVTNETTSGEQGPGLKVWRVVHLLEGGLGAHKVPYGTHLDACPANANAATKFLHTLNSEAAELSLEAAQKMVQAFGFKFEASEQL